jgi:lipoprotein-releasing system permease protein
MNGWTEDSLGTYELYFKKDVDVAKQTASLVKSLPMEWKAETVFELNPAIFDWMSMLDRNIVIFISLLLVVACFNLVATLWVLIMERIPMVGLLKALGSSHAQIRMLFWWNGFFILIRGIVIGNLLAVLFCWMQSSYHLILWILKLLHECRTDSLGRFNLILVEPRHLFTGRPHHDHSDLFH